MDKDIQHELPRDDMIKELRKSLEEIERTEERKILQDKNKVKQDKKDEIDGCSVTKKKNNKGIGSFCGTIIKNKSQKGILIRIVVYHQKKGNKASLIIKAT